MRLIPLLWLLLFTSSAHAASIAGQAPPKPRLTIAADEWCPINCIPGSPRPGIGIELANYAFRPLGYEIEYITMPWKDALEQVRAGKVDAVVGASRSDDASLIFPANGIHYITDDFYVQAGNPWRYQGPASLARQRIGIIEDYGYGVVVSKFIAANKAMSGAVFVATGKTALQENLKKLAARQIDVIIESRPVMDYTLARLGMEDQLQWVGSSADGQPVYLAFSPALAQSKTRAGQYDAAIAKLRNTGGLEAMYKLYALKP